MADIIRIDGADHPPAFDEPDAHGQAALMLSESILHGLVETKILTIENALAIIQTAQEVKTEVGKEASEKRGTIEKSLQLLDSIATSFGTDLN